MFIHLNDFILVYLVWCSFFPMLRLLSKPFGALKKKCWWLEMKISLVGIFFFFFLWGRGRKCVLFQNVWLAFIFSANPIRKLLLLVFLLQIFMSSKCCSLISSSSSSFLFLNFWLYADSPLSIYCGVFVISAFKQYLFWKSYFIDLFSLS